MSCAKAKNSRKGEPDTVMYECMTPTASYNVLHQNKPLEDFIVEAHRRSLLATDSKEDENYEHREEALSSSAQHTPGSSASL